MAVQNSSSSLQLWPAIIKSVTSVYGFFTLVVLVIDISLVAVAASSSEPQKSVFIIICLIILVLIVVAIIWLAVNYPHVLGIDSPPNRTLARVIGERVAKSVDPYLRNLPREERKEAILVLVNYLELEEDAFSNRQREFVTWINAAIQREMHFSWPVTAERASIKILSPNQNNEVDFLAQIHGHVYPENQPVQVLVLSGDNKWHPQRKVEVIGSEWTANCQFGDKEKSGSHYRVIAVVSDSIVNEPVSNLPPVKAKSEIINVTRRQQH